MNPRDLGLPSKFSKWRPHQEKAMWDIRGHQGPYSMLIAPTGVGKSLIYVATALDRGGRTVILTSTKALQDQLMRDFEECGMVQMRGRNNYPCPVVGGTAENGICRWGFSCSAKEFGCPYYRDLRKANKANLVVTNYAYWFMGKLEPADMLVLDEAHSAFDHLANYGEVSINFMAISRLLGADLLVPEVIDKSWTWKTVGLVSKKLGEVMKDPSRDMKKLRKLSGLESILKRLGNLLNYPVVVERKGLEARAGIRNPADIRDTLFKETPYTVMVSATASPKTAEMLGVPGELGEYQYPSPFPLPNRPVYMLDCVEVDRKSIDEQLNLWALTIKHIIKARVDRRGIIHTVSYDRREDLVRRMRLEPEIVVLRPVARSLSSTVSAFRHRDPPVVLASPSVVTGYDFPDDDCRYQIVAKVPFPDTSSKIERTRAKDDPDLPFYHAWQQIVQAAGRGVRSASDWCETFIVDNHFEWLFRDYKRFCPRWFSPAVRRIKTIPKPKRR